jgi:hypothetical protein
MAASQFLHEMVFWVVSLGGKVALDLYPFKKLLLLNQLNLGRIQPQKCQPCFATNKLVLNEKPPNQPQILALATAPDRDLFNRSRDDDDAGRNREFLPPD